MAEDSITKTLEELSKKLDLIMKGGIPKEAAKKLGKKYASIKNEIMRQIRGSVWKIGH